MSPPNEAPPDNEAPLDPRVYRCCQLASPLVLLVLLVLLGSTAGGLKLYFKGVSAHGASLSRCSFLPNDAPFEYPMQPSALDDPPYSTLFENVCINGGTERSRMDMDTVTNRNDTYVCSCCGAKLFGGEAKFDSGTGWPSFWAPYDAGAVGYSRDLMSVELHCSNCKAHLGHVFTWSQSSLPLQLRYCINGVCLRKVPRAADETGGAHMDNPILLPELVVLLVAVLLIVSCIGSGVSAVTIVGDGLRLWMRRRGVVARTKPAVGTRSAA